MRDVGDPAATRGHRREKCNRAEDHHEPLGLDRNDHVQVDDSVREQNAVSKQQSVYRAGRTNGRGSGVWTYKDRGDGRTDSANEEILRELLRSPDRLQLRAKHVKSEHVEENVENSGVQEDVCDELPEI